MITITAPAKINLTLRILGKRADGYHALESVMQTVSLVDTLHIQPARELSFHCDTHSLNYANNLVLKAARLLRDETGCKMGARITLEKNIPTRAGLGGGSSDAASTLVGLDKLWGLKLPVADLAVLAARLGSDIPFFLYAPTALISGRGEVVTPLPAPPSFNVVLVKPKTGLPTPQVYAELHAAPLPQMGEGNAPETTAMLAVLAQGDPAAIAAQLVNDLQPPAFHLLPELAHLRDKMQESGCISAMLSGSGSALFGICPDDTTASHVAKKLHHQGLWTWSGVTL
ncbi:MAG: 4-(cytidine 5'-diphospho)-2-C-methyl-D-erythritol kinase [bacterium]